MAAGQGETMVDFHGTASVGVDTRHPSMPAPGAWSKLCYCYTCNREESATECTDLELRCLRCGGTCVEVLNEGEAPSVPPPPLPPPGELTSNLYAAVPAVPVSSEWPVAAASEEPSAGHEEPPPEAVPETSLRRRRSALSRRSWQSPSGHSMLPPGHFRARVPRIGGEGHAERRLSSRAQRIAGEGPRHVGVICDGCRTSSFTGVRYRCLRCSDYDLCASCHARRSVLHPSHPFEAIRTPRSTVPALVADFMAQSATRTVVAIFEIGLEGDTEARSGLDDSRVSWWLADDHRLVSADWMAEEDPTWCCPICSEGIEAEGSNGWVVQICTGKGASSEGASDGRQSGPDGAAADGAEPSTAGASEGHGHVYHEACLRKWLLKRNSCPVCRRAPIVPVP